MILLNIRVLTNGVLVSGTSRSVTVDPNISVMTFIFTGVCLLGFRIRGFRFQGLHETVCDFTNKLTKLTSSSQCYYSCVDYSNFQFFVEYTEDYVINVMLCMVHSVWIKGKKTNISPTVMVIQ